MELRRLPAPNLHHYPGPNLYLRLRLPNPQTRRHRPQPSPLPHPRRLVPAHLPARRPNLPNHPGHRRRHCRCRGQ